LVEFGNGLTNKRENSDENYVCPSLLDQGTYSSCKIYAANLDGTSKKARVGIGFNGSYVRRAGLFGRSAWPESRNATSADGPAWPECTVPQNVTWNSRDVLCMTYSTGVSEKTDVYVKHVPYGLS